MRYLLAAILSTLTNGNVRGETRDAFFDLKKKDKERERERKEYRMQMDHKGKWDGSCSVVVRNGSYAGNQ